MNNGRNLVRVELVQHSSPVQTTNKTLPQKHRKQNLKKRERERDNTYSPYEPMKVTSSGGEMKQPQAFVKLFFLGNFK